MDAASPAEVTRLDQTKAKGERLRTALIIAGDGEGGRIVSPIAHVDITPFNAEHLDAAAVLLATRHRDDRTREPELPARFEAPGATRAVLGRMFQRPESTGVVAVRLGRMVGYVLGITVFTPPTSRGAAFLAPRAGFIGYAGRAVDAEDATDVHGALYSALATDWVEAGCLTHYVQVAPTDARTEERWHTLGFGREFVTAMRDTAALAPADWPGDSRRAGPEDLDTILGFINGLHRFEAGAPMWRPYLPETEPDDRTFYAQMLDDSACACWIASQAGQPLAMQSFQPPPSYLSPMIVPDQSVYLLHGYTEPAARGRRIGTNLLASALAWAREAGHRHCLLDYRAANLVSARFWHGLGFRPIAYRLCHRLDERLVWARPRDHAA